jgi:hypothetical protein
MGRLGIMLAVLILGTVALRAQTNQTEVQTSPSNPAKFDKEIWQVRRLETPEFIRSKSLKLRGPIVRVVKAPKPGQVLQLINPFAPVSAGTGEPPPVVWNTFAGAGVRPRAFRDPMTEEPLPLISIGK